MKRVRIPLTRKERYWKMVDRFDRDDPSLCWLWRGRMRDGYGRFESRSAHLFAYEWQVGPIPAGFQVDHLCRERRCVRPSHLEAVTQRENQRRKYRKPQRRANGLFDGEGVA